MDIFSKYPSYLRELRFRLTTIGSRIIRNTWRRSVGRFRKFSWWMIGLFLGPQARDTLSRISLAPTADDSHTCAGTARPLETPGFRPQQEPGPRHGCESGTVIHSCSLSWTEKPRMLDDPFGCVPPPRYTSFSYSLGLWAKFSLALVFAIGMAIRHGPESLLEDDLRAKRMSPHDSNQSNSSITTDPFD